MTFTSETLKQTITELEAEMRKPDAVLFSQARYEIRRVLGEGGMGITCLADEISAANLKRPVVLKFAKDSLDRDRLAQFFNEVQLSILFNHPNLVPVYRLESETITVEPPKARALRWRSHEHTVYYAVMQYIDGWNVRQIVERLRNLHIYLHPDISTYIIGRVARGLHYVHQYRDESGNPLGLVHRDVSPENVLIDHFGRIKVADFGIATSSKQTRATSPMGNNPGKLLYASPEQLMRQPLDARSDIYAVGLLMYFVFTNLDRFGPEFHLPRARDRILRKMKRSPVSEMKHVSPRLSHMCEVCLRESPGERYQNCEDLSTDIDIYFQETQKVVTNDQLEEILGDLFSSSPDFVSRRFIPLTGSPQLVQAAYDPAAAPSPEEVPVGPISTLRMVDDEG